jgi:hypothetical protein
MSVVEDRGAKIHCEQQGQGEPVLLIIGLGWDSNMWYRTRSVLQFAVFSGTLTTLTS